MPLVFCHETAVAACQRVSDAHIQTNRGADVWMLSQRLQASDGNAGIIVFAGALERQFAGFNPRIPVGAQQSGLVAEAHRANRGHMDDAGIAVDHAGKFRTTEWRLALQLPLKSLACILSATARLHRAGARLAR